MNTLSSDKAIGMAKGKSFSSPKKLDPSETHRTSTSLVLLNLLLLLMIRSRSRIRIRIGSRQWDNQRNIMTRVQPHDLAGANRPIQPLYPPTRVLYHQSRSINGLTVTHLREQKKTKDERKVDKEEEEGLGGGMRSKSLSIQLSQTPHSQTPNILRSETNEGLIIRKKETRSSRPSFFPYLPTNSCYVRQFKPNFDIKTA